MSTASSARRDIASEIRVDAIVPRFATTSYNLDTYAKGTEKWVSIDEWTPLFRVAAHEEMASAVIYLASNAASYTTGGGFSRSAL